MNALGQQTCAIGGCRSTPGIAASEAACLINSRASFTLALCLFMHSFCCILFTASFSSGVWYNGGLPRFEGTRNPFLINSSTVTDGMTLFTKYNKNF